MVTSFFKKPQYPAEIVPDVFEIESVNEETIYDRILWGVCFLRGKKKCCV